MFEGDVEATVVRKCEDHLEVELFSPKSSDPQMSFNSILADAGMAPQPIAPAPPSSEASPSVAAASTQEQLPSLVVWINSPGDFYVQCINDTNAIATLQITLNSHYANSASSGNYVPALGDKCAALYSDGAWYRAKAVEMMSPLSTKVLFLDYGNEEVVVNDNIRPLEKQFHEEPGKALHCGLDRVAPLGGQGGKWSEEALTFMRQKVGCLGFIHRVVKVSLI